MKKTVLALCSLASAGMLWGATYYVDSKNGDDAADGLSPQTAWKTLDRVNVAPLKPGDTMLFARGSVWRGQLASVSGEPGRPVTYSAYGKGPKPVFLGSVDYTDPSRWTDVGDGIWATRSPVLRQGRALGGLGMSGWYGSFQQGLRGSLKRMKGTQGGDALPTGEAKDGDFWRVHCEKRPPMASESHLQIWGPKTVAPSTGLTVTLRMRSSKPIALGACEMMTPCPPWMKSHQGALTSGGVTLGKEWRTVTAFLRRNAALERDVSFHLALGTTLPAGTDLDFIPVSCTETFADDDCLLDRDIGIFICNHGERWGVKKWSKETLTNDLDYWYDPGAFRVYVKSGENPGKRFRSVELAKTWTVISHSGRHDIVWNALDVRCSGGFAFSGGNARNLIVRNCDMSWIGGGLQYWKMDAKGNRIPVRYGNGVEYWSPSYSNLVERCRIWQVYDAALTPQTSKSPNPIHDIVFRDNVIWQAEYSYEYWDHDPRSYTANIIFEHNTCVDAGYCWSHDQRPNPNGAHVMCYANIAPSTNIVFRNNIFCRTTDRSVRVWGDWRKSLVTERNLFWIPQNSVYGWEGKLPGVKPEDRVFGAGPEEFARYQKAVQIDLTSVYGEPQFVDESKRDYRLKPGTVGTSLATDGGPVGARDMPGLDQDQSAER